MSKVMLMMFQCTNCNDVLNEYFCRPVFLYEIVEHRCLCNECLERLGVELITEDSEEFQRIHPGILNDLGDDEALGKLISEDDVDNND